jgi:nucleoside-diphosphate kinase
VQRSLIGEVIQRYERTGLKLIALKMLIPTKELIEKHYSVDPDWIKKAGEKSIASYQKRGLKPPVSDAVELGKIVLARLQKYFTSGPAIAMIWQGNQAVGMVRKITGGTEPLTSDVGTIRGDLTIDSYQISDIDDRAIRNLIHASGNPEEAEKEIALWFPPKEILEYRLVQEQILYDVDMNGTKE